MLRSRLILQVPNPCAGSAPFVRAAPALFRPSLAEQCDSTERAQGCSPLAPYRPHAHFGDESCECREIARRDPESLDLSAHRQLCASLPRGLPHSGAYLQFPAVRRSWREFARGLPAPTARDESAPREISGPACLMGASALRDSRRDRHRPLPRNLRGRAHRHPP